MISLVSSVKSLGFRVRSPLAIALFLVSRSTQSGDHRYLSYRLWIDQPDRIWTPASPFIGFPGDPPYQGVGLRDGLRYKSSSRPPYHWTFTRPKLNTNDPVLRIAAEFFAEDGTILSSQTQSFQSWQLRNDARGENALGWQADPARSAYTAFLQAKLKSDDAPQPIVEMKWEASRPDEAGLRIADTPANDRVRQWRLRILDGTKHLWRELQIGDRVIKADKVIDDSGAKPSDAAVTLDLGDSTKADTRLRWQTDETLPVQVLERKQKRYAGMGLYKGLDTGTIWRTKTTHEPLLWRHVFWRHESPERQSKLRSRYG